MRSATQRVVHQLRTEILSFQLQPGEPLGEDELARRLEVSRTPIREALSWLEQEGLIRRIPKRGAIVADVSTASVLEAYEIRQRLESLAAHKAVENITDEQIREIRGTAATMHPRPQSISEVLDNDKLDRHIHAIVLQAAGSQLLSEIVDATRQRTHRLMFVVPPGRYRTSIDEHDALADALAARDADAAERAMQTHLSLAAKRLNPM